MESSRIELRSSFSERLIVSLKKRGYVSFRSNSGGVDVSELSGIVSCSYQMARKYVLGKAIPDNNAILAISKWLNIDPGWLLFGSGPHRHDPAAKETVLIEKSLLKRVLVKAHNLFRHEDNSEDIAHFLLDVIHDASHLQSDHQTTEKMIDLAISSASRFVKPEQSSKHQKCA